MCRQTLNVLKDDFKPIKGGVEFYKKVWQNTTPDLQFDLKEKTILVNEVLEDFFSKIQQTFQKKFQKTTRISKIQFNGRLFTL